MFKKDDTTKTMYSEVLPDFLQDVADVLTYGVNKYGRKNWQECKDMDIYIDALYRHIEAYRKGENKDKDTGISHLAHAVCNIMFLYYNERKDERKDDTRV